MGGRRFQHGVYIMLFLIVVFTVLPKVTSDALWFYLGLTMIQSFQEFNLGVFFHLLLLFSDREGCWVISLSNLALLTFGPGRFIVTTRGGCQGPVERLCRVPASATHNRVHRFEQGHLTGECGACVCVCF